MARTRLWGRAGLLFDVLLIVFAAAALLASVVPFAGLVLDLGLMSLNQTPLIERAGVAEPYSRLNCVRTYWDLWRGPMPRPYRASGDYLVVLDHHAGDPRLAGNAIATLIERERRSGAHVEALVIPDDLESYGPEIEVAAMPRADGTAIESQRRTFYVSQMRLLTAVPVIERAYDPVLTEQQVSALAAESGLDGSPTVWMSAAAPSDGVYVLHIGPDEQASYIVPRQSSPVGDRL